MDLVDIVKGLWPDRELPRYDFPARSEVNVELPDWVKTSPILPWVRQEIGGDKVWNHQGLALDAFQRGENVALTSSTNSGKSLIPQITFLHGLMTDPKATYIVILPFTALNRDQLTRWDAAAEILKLPKKWFVKIDRSMPVDFRLPAMKDARMLFITAHSGHGWLMDNLEDPGVHRIVKNIRGAFLDEIQSYGDVVGVNTALFLRRFSTIRRMLNPKSDIQWIAASGTIGRPKAFLKNLVSRDFTVIGQNEDGSRQSMRSVFHIDTPTFTGRRTEGLRAASEIIEKGNQSGLLLYFIDSQSRVEEIAEVLKARHGDDAVMAYSGRYSRASARSQSEGLLDDFNERINSGTLRAIVTTSALQSGVNLRSVDAVINDGIPFDVNTFFQRLGRAGRGAQDAVAIMIGDGARFARFAIDNKDGFTSYMQAEPNSPAINLDNRALLFIHLQCLLAERRRVGLQQQKIPAVVSWPKGSNDLIKMAGQHRSQLPLELQPLKVELIDRREAEFPLLNTGMRVASVILYQEGRKEIRLTDMSVDRALRDCPPGGTYRFGNRYYFVRGWRHTRTGWRIATDISKSGAATRGIVEQTVNANLHSGNVIQNNYLAHAEGPQRGFIAEMTMQMVAKLTGLSGRFHTDEGIRSFKLQYRDVEREADEAAATQAAGDDKSKKDEKPVRYSKFFAQKIFQNTTGIIVHLPEAWFSKEDREILARTLITSFMRARGTEIADPSRLDTIGYEVGNVSLQHEVGGVMKGGTIAIFDKVQGGLRLTELVFSDFRAHLEDAIREDQEALGEKNIAALKQVLDWHQKLEPQPLPSPQEFVHGDRIAPTPEGHALMFAIGSVVDRERDGVRVAMKVIGYSHMENPETNEKFLSYRLQAPYVASATRFVMATFDHAGHLITARNENQEMPVDAAAIVPKDQVQAPLSHVRFAYAWVNEKTLEATAPQTAESQPTISGTVLHHDAV